MLGAYLLTILRKSLPIKTIRSLSHEQVSMRYLNQKEARRLDEELFSPSYAFNVSQLMELAGLSVAHALHRVYPTEDVFIVSGPGNNGGDGLVAARHLSTLGHKVTLFIPKRNPLFESLITQCNGFQDIEILSDQKWKPGSLQMHAGVVLDALFGFSFKPPIRESFVPIMRDMKECGLPLVSVDIPSGWDVEKGPLGTDLDLSPNVLVSLSAPKICANYFKGSHHFLGGRFLPHRIIDSYGLNDLPPYPGMDSIVRL